MILALFRWEFILSSDTVVQQENHWLDEADKVSQQDYWYHLGESISGVNSFLLDLILSQTIISVIVCLAESSPKI